MLKEYVKLAFGYRGDDGHFRTYFVAEDVRGCNVKPWAVFIRHEGKGFVQQVSPWYCYRGWAERYIRKLKTNTLRNK